MYQSLEYADIFKVLIEFSPDPARREKPAAGQIRPGFVILGFFCTEMTRKDKKSAVFSRGNIYPGRHVFCS